MGPLFILYICFMINHVRNTVLTILNKENRGFLTPAQFNSYAKYAQQLIFDDYFNEFEKYQTLDNNRRVHSGTGDIKGRLMQKIEKFIKTSTVSEEYGYYSQPSDLYKIQRITYSGKNVEHVTPLKKVYLDLSNIAGPSEEYPSYCMEESNIYLYPSSLDDDIKLMYVRKPLDPKWTYQTIGENPIYNPSASDHQDFELFADDESRLITEILKLTGLTIREPQIVQAGTGLEQQEEQRDNV